MVMGKRHSTNFTLINGMDMANRFYRDAYKFNRKMFENLHYLSASRMSEEFHIVCHNTNDLVMGDLELEQSPYDDHIIWLKHVVVDERFRGRGIASELLDRAFNHVNELGKTLELSSYSPMGLEYLKPVIKRLVQQYDKLDVVEPYDYDEDFRLAPVSNSHSAVTS
jgi:GNAT superfamily N-acetyltransferase